MDRCDSYSPEIYNQRQAPELQNKQSPNSTLTGIKTMNLCSTEELVGEAAHSVTDLIEQVLVPGLVLTRYLNAAHMWIYYDL